jgi:hypothetical protein
MDMISLPSKKILESLLLSFSDIEAPDIFLKADRFKQSKK